MHLSFQIASNSPDKMAILLFPILNVIWCEHLFIHTFSLFFCQYLTVCVPCLHLKIRWITFLRSLKTDLTTNKTEFCCLFWFFFFFPWLKVLSLSKFIQILCIVLTHPVLLLIMFHYLMMHRFSHVFGNVCMNSTVKQLYIIKMKRFVRCSLS
jgi:hypothetical protein